LRMCRDRRGDGEIISSRLPAEHKDKGRAQSQDPETTTRAETKKSLDT